MKTVDMVKYRPFAGMGKTCATRKIKEKKIVWPLEIGGQDVRDGRFRIRALDRDDIDQVAELWRASYPEVYGSLHDWVLYPEDYEERVALAEDWTRDCTLKMYAMYVGEDRETGHIAMAVLFTKYDQNLHIEATVFAVHPDYRKGKQGYDIWAGMAGFYQWMQDSGAEYVTVFCETWHDITQYMWFKRMGWKVAGIFPGNFTRWNGDQEEYRGCTVHFYRLINDGEKYSTKREEWRLLPEISRLWDCLAEINELSEDSGLRGNE
ncbi:hypothetical protein ACFL9T_05290 [Thermodesulfobacteriota bacterium]